MKASLKFFSIHIFLLFALLSQDTYVSQSFLSDNPFFYYLSLCLIFTTIVCYSGVLGNPGYVSLDKEYNSPFFCRSCQKRVPVRAFHCEKCHRCIVRQLYHSKWADSCIGFNNYMFYIFFLFLEFLTLLFTDIISVISLVQKANFEGTSIKWFWNHFLLIVLIPFCSLYLIQILILLLQHCYIIITSGNVLETRNICGFMYLYIQPKNHNPFFSYKMEKNLSEVFSPADVKEYEISDTSKLSYYNEDIQNYKDIDYIKDPQ